MKLVVIIFSFLSCGVAVADQMQETFLKAGAYYDQGHLKEALELYKKIAAPYPSVFYNKGLCYYALGAYPEALAALRNAQRLGNRELFVKASRAIALTQQKAGFPDDASFLHVALVVNNFVPHDALRVFFLLMLACFSVLIWRRTGSRRSLGVGAFCLLVMGTLCGYDYWFSQQRYGIVLHKNTTVYAGPDAEFHKVSELDSGQQVKVVEHEQSWYKVYFPAGQGWVQEADLGVF